MSSGTVQAKEPVPGAETRGQLALLERLIEAYRGNKLRQGEQS